MKLFKNQLQEVFTPVSTKEVIEQIHNEFNCAGEALLAEAKEILAASNYSTDKAMKLKELGFTNVPEVVEIAKKEQKKKMADTTVRLINHYMMRYPNQKFITEEMVGDICKKYNLVCGGVELYKGFVPKKNMEEIASFKVDNSDLPIYYIEIKKQWIPTSLEHSDINEGFEGYLKRHDSHYYNYAVINSSRTDNPRICNGSTQNLNTLRICAPIKEMNTEGMGLNGYHLQKHIPDPVVLQPVKGGYLILTAWGDEASDPIVVNERNN